MFFGLITLIPCLAYFFVSIVIHFDKLKLCIGLLRKDEEISKFESSKFTPSRVVPKCNKRLKKVDFSTIVEERTFVEEEPINLSSISRITPVFQGSFLTKGRRRLSESAEESPCASTPVESRYRAERFNSTFKDSSGIDIDSNYNELHHARKRSDFSVDSVFSYETEC